MKAVERRRPAEGRICHPQYKYSTKKRRAVKGANPYQLFGRTKAGGKRQRRLEKQIICYLSADNGRWKMDEVDR